MSKQYEIGCTKPAVQGETEGECTSRQKRSEGVDMEASYHHRQLECSPWRSVWRV